MAPADVLGVTPAVAPVQARTVAGSISVEVVYCPTPGPGDCDRVTVSLPVGATLAQALTASGVLQRNGLEIEGLRVGVWTKLRALDTVLVERDRVEIYRPLKVDPKEARRQRYQRHLDSRAAREARGGRASQKGPAAAP
jgi:putative ubiquitin-RnfH superfamily antitoxin RatB of RatAB toxin-antitoxin module